jgi:hypothetical protein
VLIVLYIWCIKSLIFSLIWVLNVSALAKLIKLAQLVAYLCLNENVRYSVYLDGSFQLCDPILVAKKLYYELVIEDE